MINSQRSLGLEQRANIPVWMMLVCQCCIDLAERLFNLSPKRKSHVICPIYHFSLNRSYSVIGCLKACYLSEVWLTLNRCWIKKLSDWDVINQTGSWMGSGEEQGENSLGGLLLTCRTPGVLSDDDDQLVRPLTLATCPEPSWYAWCEAGRDFLCVLYSIHSFQLSSQT
jgi:hypothetical protein